MFRSRFYYDLFRLTWICNTISIPGNNVNFWITYCLSYFNTHITMPRCLTCLETCTLYKFTWLLLMVCFVKERWIKNLLETNFIEKSTYMWNIIINSNSYKFALTRKGWFNKVYTFTCTGLVVECSMNRSSLNT